MKICIIGVGNIGFRYVQGIIKTFEHAQLVLVDRPERLRELAQMQLVNVTLCGSVDELEATFDLIVVATSCKPRFDVYKRCLELKPRYIILEKYLFSERAEFEESVRLKSVPTFVNQWMYGSKTFDCLFQGDASTVVLTGSKWGLACNSIHWIDVFKRHLEITDLRVAPATTTSAVFPAKRDGYEEVAGEWVFADGNSDKTFTLRDLNADEPMEGLSITVDGRAYVFDYAAVRDGEKALSQFPYFSEQIGGIVSDLLSTGSCHLPTLEESVSQHLLVEDILAQLDRRPLIT